VRRLIILLPLAFSLSVARAQEQERKLLDRLLKPDTTLQNAAQNKKFVADKRSIDKHAVVNSFYVPEKSLAKQYAAERKFSAKEFAAHHFRDGEIAATVRARAQRLQQVDVSSAAGTLAVRNSSENGKKIATSEFAGSRPFLGRGKSQKALSQQDTPLTIDQVRELLNKNK
jgi:hypothetical protein